jgi:hypothetical protein
MAACGAVSYARCGGGDVDLAKNVIHVERGWDDRDGEQGTKSDKPRKVPVVPDLAATWSNTASEPKTLKAWSSGKAPGPSR